MSRHAYLIMAHTNPEQLSKLLHLLDDPRNDIFIHIDAGAAFCFESLGFAFNHSEIVPVERLPVLWAEYSMVEAELQLLRKAHDRGGYAYYHLLSGMDLPLKTQDEIHNFFENESREFIGTAPQEGPYQLNHVRYAYPLLRLRIFRQSKTIKALSECMALLQKLIGVNRVRDFMAQGWHFYDGWQWFSITDAFASYVLNHEHLIRRIFTKAKAPDEMFMQTLAMNSPFKERLASTTDLQDGSMRCIDWKRGKPYTYRKEDFDELILSPYLFARKFDERVGNGIIEMICDYLKERERL